MRIDEFLVLVDGGRYVSGEYRCRCPGPVHQNGDRHPSLSVLEGERGLLLYCHAGCTTTDICSSLGIAISDLFYDPLRRTRPRSRWSARDLLEIAWGEALVVAIAAEILTLGEPLEDKDMERLRHAADRLGKLAIESRNSA